MAQSKAIREATARLAALEAQRAELEKGIRDAEAKRAPLKKAWQALAQRLGRTPIISNTGGTFWQGSLASFTTESYGTRALGQKLGVGRKLAQELEDAVVAGTLKVNGAGGVALTWRGLAGRIRKPTRTALVAYQRAAKARALADKKARAARDAEDAAKRAIFDTGEKITQEDLLRQFVATAIAFLKLDREPEAHDLRHQLARLTEWDTSPLKVAEAHLAFAKSGAEGICPCSDCARDRAEAIRIRDLTARLAELPKRRAACPTHGKKLMASESVMREYVKFSDDEGRWVENVPVAWCPVGPHRLIDTPAIKAREAKAAAKKKPGIVWVCPNGDGPQTTEVQTDRDDGVKWVECPECETAFELDAVKLVEAKKAA